LRGGVSSWRWLPLPSGTSHGPPRRRISVVAEEAEEVVVVVVVVEAVAVVF
jgi:hypothetical protein